MEPTGDANSSDEEVWYFLHLSSSHAVAKITVVEVIDIPLNFSLVLLRWWKRAMETSHISQIFKIAVCFLIPSQTYEII